MSRTDRTSLRCGIIGAGNIAWKYDGGRYNGERSVTHASCIDRHERCELVAIYDPVEAALSDAHAVLGADVSYYGDLDGFFASGLDLVSIASPSDLHVTHVNLCLENDISYIWLEKPVTLELSTHSALLDAFQKIKNPPRLSVNYPRRGLAQYRQLKSKISTDGMPLGLEINYSRGLETNGVHMLDMIDYLLDPEEAPDLDWCRDADTPNPEFGFSIGRTKVTVTGYDLPYHLIEVRSIFADGRTTVGRGGLASITEPVEENPDYPGFYHTAAASPNMMENIARSQMINGSYNNLCNLLDDEAPLGSSLETAWFTQAILDSVKHQRLK